MAPVRIAVLSDDRLFCEGLLKLVGGDISLELVGDHGATALRQPHGEAAAHVLLIDSRMHGALDLCASVRDNGGPAVILVGAPNDEAWATRALNAGARGILPRQARAEDLRKAVRVVDDGSIWAPRRVMAACIFHLTGKAATKRASTRRVERLLSSRERDVFRLAAAGRGNKAIAGMLAISEATVKVHLTHIFQKLGLHGRAELAAVYHGLLPHPNVVRRSA